MLDVSDERWLIDLRQRVRQVPGLNHPLWRGILRFAAQRGAPVKVPQKSTESARGGARFARQLSSRLAFVTRDFGATFAFFRIREIDAKVAKVQNSRRARNSNARLTRRVGADGKIEMPKSYRDVSGSCQTLRRGRSVACWTVRVVNYCWPPSRTVWSRRRQRASAPGSAGG
jgi:hypothetical protein